MTYRALLLSLTLALAACADFNPGPPPVDVGAFGALIAELQLAEAAAAEVPVLVRDSMQAVFFDSVLADHGYSRAEFDSIMWQIRAEPLWIDSVYTRAGEIVARRLVNEQ